MKKYSIFIKHRFNNIKKCEIETKNQQKKTNIFTANNEVQARVHVNVWNFYTYIIAWYIV